MQNSSEKNWLVKSSTRILGPYTLEELKGLLATKGISIIDEVRNSAGRWSYIREHKEFLEVVRRIRDDVDPFSEKTMTQSIAQHTQTKTENLMGSEDITVTPTPIVPEKKQTPSIPTIKDVTPVSEKVLSRSSSDSGAKSYGFSSDAAIKNQINQRTSAAKWFVLGAIAVIAIGVGVRLVYEGRQKNLGYEDLLTQAIRYKSLGLYDKSLEIYKKAVAQKEPDLEIQVQMAPVLISEDKQSLTGRRILEKALTLEGRPRDEVVGAYIGIGVSHMLDGDLKEAEDTLMKALGYEPTNFPAQMNMAIIKMKKGNYSEAAKDCASLYKKNPQAILPLFCQAISQLEVSKNTADHASLAKLADEIRKAVKNTSYLRQEFTMFLIYSDILNGKEESTFKDISTFLSLSPFETDRFVKDLLIDDRFTQWDQIERYCAEIFNRQTPQSELKAMRAICLMKVNRSSEAEKLLSEAMAESPKDPYVIVSYAAFLKNSGKAVEASSLLKVPEVSPLGLRDQLTGEICLESGDPACVQRYFTQLYSKEPRSAAALYGLAWSAQHNRDRARAYEYARGGLQIEPLYVPLIELRDQLEAE